MDLYTLLTSIIGTPPTGYEPLVYTFGLLAGYSILDMLIGLFRKVGGFLN